MEIKDFSKVMPAIIKKVGNRPCPMCGNLSGFNVEPTEFQNTSFQRNVNELQFTGEYRYIPCVSAICKHCGYIANFYIPILLDDPNYLTR